MSKTYTAALAIIGNEILSGRTQDKNLSHLALKLNEAGIQLREARVVPDIEDEIVAAVNALRARYDYVFTTGGIGPTHDDITTASVAKAFGVQPYRHPEAEAALRAHYEPGAVNEARLKMAEVPQGATLIPNKVSTAPGFVIGNVYVMAGIPNIMQAMLEATIPLLKGGDSVETLTVTTNLLEGALAADLTAIQNRYPDVEIGSYPHFIDNERSTTLVCRATNRADNVASMKAIRAMIQTLGGRELPDPAA